MGTDSIQFTDIASTTANFGLLGGKYALAIDATWNSGNAQLETLADDGATWINVGSSITANGFSNYDLPAGQYRIAISAASSVYVSITRIVED